VPPPCPRLTACLAARARRAYRKQKHFTTASDELMELNAFAYISQKAANSWLSMRLDVSLSGRRLCLLPASWLRLRQPHPGRRVG
jgi:hypothetical protein